VPALVSVPTVLLALPTHVAPWLLLMIPALVRTAPVHVAPLLLLIVPVLVATFPLKLLLLLMVPALFRSSWIVPLLVIKPPKLLGVPGFANKVPPGANCTGTGFGHEPGNCIVAAPFARQRGTTCMGEGAVARHKAADVESAAGVVGDGTVDLPAGVHRSGVGQA